MAKENYTIAIAKMPFNLAVFASNRATDIIEEYAEVHTWAIGGHSLGGTMASRYIYSNPDKINKLVLLASYPAKSNDLSLYNINVISIFGSQDGLISEEDIKNSKQLLPKSITWVKIQGGNHSQFGGYVFNLRMVRLKLRGLSNRKSL